MLRLTLRVALVFAVCLAPLCFGQGIPATAGETLTGKNIVLANEVRGHRAVLIAGFSHDGGVRSGEWVKAIHADGAFAGIPVYQIAMLASAPAFVRGMIKSGMKKGMSPEEQDRTVVLIEDQKRWQEFFQVSTDKDPYCMLIDAAGKVLWVGHGSATQLESQLRAALH
jgi:hypothetical protein